MRKSPETSFPLVVVRLPVTMVLNSKNKTCTEFGVLYQTCSCYSWILIENPGYTVFIGPRNSTFLLIDLPVNKSGTRRERSIDSLRVAVME